MSNLTTLAGTTSNITWGSNTMPTGGGYYCITHGWGVCGCSNIGVYPAPLNNYVLCSTCSQWYYSNTIHACNTYQAVPLTWTNTGTSTFALGPEFKEVKEITTDNELIYEWADYSFRMKLPAKFSDCFLKVGYAWSPLYPLIFSAFEKDSKELSFHLVMGITDKVFEGDKVILKSVTTTKIEDNLTLLQLTNRVRQYFEEK